MILVGDIGGTHTRLALFEGREVLYEEDYPSHAYKSLILILEDFLTKKAVSLEGACFGIAGPVEHGQCHTTNLPWVVEAKQISDVLHTPNVWIINDVEAHAWGIEWLQPDDLFVLNRGEKKEGNAALIAAGTGLGEAGLVWDGVRYHPFACEGGHCDFAPLQEEDLEFWRYLKLQFGHVSYERVLSGAGLYQIFRFLRASGLENEQVEELDVGAEDPAKMITQRALRGESKACARALDWFALLYGSEAGNLALKFLARSGLYIGGGIAPKILQVLNAGPFMRAFVAKGRFGPLLAKIPVHVILNDKTALLGAARYAVEYSHLP